MKRFSKRNIELSCSLQEVLRVNGKDETKYYLYRYSEDNFDVDTLYEEMRDKYNTRNHKGDMEE
jgi:hypothetical protein